MRMGGTDIGAAHARRLRQRTRRIPQDLAVQASSIVEDEAAACSADNVAASEWQGSGSATRCCVISGL